MSLSASNRIVDKHELVGIRIGLPISHDSSSQTPPDWEVSLIYCYAHSQYCRIIIEGNEWETVEEFIDEFCKEAPKVAIEYSRHVCLFYCAHIRPHRGRKRFRAVQKRNEKIQFNDTILRVLFRCAC
jgi:hypothetical protein